MSGNNSTESRSQTTLSREGLATADTPDRLPRSTRLVLAIGILSGITGILTTAIVDPRQFMLASDVYLAAGDAVLSGETIYEVTPTDHPAYHYIYPPIVTLLFVPHGVLGSELASFTLQTLGNLTAGAGIVVVLERALTRRGIAVSRADRALLAGFVLCSSYSAITVLNGQVTLWIAFALAVGLDALDRNRERIAGTAFAAGALVKVFPAAIGLWLVRRRSWRGLAAALVTGFGGLGLGVLVFGPDLTVTYLTDVLTGRHDGFQGAPEPTETRGGAQRQIAALSGLSTPLVTGLAFCVLVPVVGALYRRVNTDERRQAAILGTIIATLLFLPLQRLYLSLLFVPLVVLLARLPAGRARTSLLAGSLVSFARVDYNVVTATVEQIPLPASVETATLLVSETVLRVVLPPTLGLWILLGGCLLVQYGQSSESYNRIDPSSRRGSST